MTFVLAQATLEREGRGARAEQPRLDVVMIVSLGVRDNLMALVDAGRYRVDQFAQLACRLGHRERFKLRTPARGEKFENMIGGREHRRRDLETPCDRLRSHRDGSISKVGHYKYPVRSIIYYSLITHSRRWGLPCCGPRRSNSSPRRAPGRKILNL